MELRNEREMVQNDVEVIVQAGFGPPGRSCGSGSARRRSCAAAPWPCLGTCIGHNIGVQAPHQPLRMAARRAQGWYPAEEHIVRIWLRKSCRSPCTGGAVVAVGGNVELGWRRGACAGRAGCVGSGRPGADHGWRGVSHGVTGAAAALVDPQPVRDVLPGRRRARRRPRRQHLLRCKVQREMAEAAVVPKDIQQSFNSKGKPPQKKRANRRTDQRMMAGMAGMASRPSTRARGDSCLRAEGGRGNGEQPGQQREKRKVARHGVTHTSGGGGGGPRPVAQPIGPPAPRSTGCAALSLG